MNTIIILHVLKELYAALTDILCAAGDRKWQTLDELIVHVAGALMDAGRAFIEACMAALRQNFLKAGMPSVHAARKAA